MWCDPRANRIALRCGPCRSSASSLLRPAWTARLELRLIAGPANRVNRPRPPEGKHETTSEVVIGISPRGLSPLVVHCQLDRLSGSADSNRGPLVPQTSAYLAPTNRIQRRVLSSGNGWNETYTPETGIAWNPVDVAGFCWTRCLPPLPHGNHGKPSECPRPTMLSTHRKRRSRRESTARAMGSYAGGSCITAATQ